MTNALSPFAKLLLYFVLTYLALLAGVARYLAEIHYAGWLTGVYATVVWVTYAGFYLLAAALPVLVVYALLCHTRLGDWLRAMHLPPFGVLYVFAVVACAALQVFIFADVFIYRMYGFHFNGFVWGILFTKGGIASMGNETSTYVSAALLVTGFVLLQTTLLVAACRSHKLHRVFAACVNRKRMLVLALALMCLSLAERITYGICSIKSYTPVAEAAMAFPFYIPMTFNKFAQKLGFAAQEARHFKIKIGSNNTNYPLQPIVRSPQARNYNIVWLLGESLRSDMIDAEIMPVTHAFANKAILFTNHYSSGNGTRMAMFGMFYGLYGTYWFPIIQERKSPVLIDFLLDAGYQIELFSSQSFTWPEYDKTLFVRMSPQQFHQSPHGAGWMRDRDNVDQMLRFLDQRDQKRPFMLFMFYDSTHSSYSFPPESTIRTPYLLDFDYITTDIKKQIGLIKNSYINAVHHLDSQIARVLRYLEQHDLLSSTIVLIAGDHGQEFMEKGRWGHHSAFTEEQARAPLILWIPGEQPRRITALTSHLDVAPTLLRLLGVTTPADAHCYGTDLLAGQRAFTIVSDWSNLCYVDRKYKFVLPLKETDFAKQKLTDVNDLPLADAASFYLDTRERMLDIMKSLPKFTQFSTRK